MSRGAISRTSQKWHDFSKSSHVPSHTEKTKSDFWSGLSLLTSSWEMRYLIRFDTINVKIPDRAGQGLIFVKSLEPFAVTQKVLMVSQEVQSRSLRHRNCLSRKAIWILSGRDCFWEGVCHIIDCPDWLDSWAPMLIFITPDFLSCQVAHSPSTRNFGDPGMSNLAVLINQRWDVLGDWCHIDRWSESLAFSILLRIIWICCCASDFQVMQ
jgi:hypothetical protein